MKRNRSRRVDGVEIAKISLLKNRSMFITCEDFLIKTFSQDQC